MKEVLELIIKNLVDSPEEVSITEKTNDDKSVSYEVQVAKDDMGKIIGKQGKMAKSIRSVVKAIGNREHIRANIEFIG